MNANFCQQFQLVLSFSLILKSFYRKFCTYLDAARNITSLVTDWLCGVNETHYRFSFHFSEMKISSSRRLLYFFCKFRLNAGQKLLEELQAIKIRIKSLFYLGSLHRQTIWNTD